MTTSDFYVKRVNFEIEQDGKDLLSALRSYALDPMGGGEDLSEDVKLNLIAKLAKHPTCHAFLIKEKQTEALAGLSICFEGFSTFACAPLLNIHDFSILPSYRGKKLGELLLRFIEDYAVSMGCCKITLEVLEGNQIAKNLYAKVGFHAYELDPQMGKALFWQKKL